MRSSSARVSLVRLCGSQPVVSSTLRSSALPQQLPRAASSQLCAHTVLLTALQPPLFLLTVGCSRVDGPLRPPLWGTLRCSVFWLLFLKLLGHSQTRLWQTEAAFLLPVFCGCSVQAV